MINGKRGQEDKWIGGQEKKWTRVLESMNHEDRQTGKNR